MAYEVISITQSKKVIHKNYTLHGQVLKRVKTTKYLAVTYSTP